jgi:hypothetical protein
VVVNVLGAGEVCFEAQLHRPPACTAATVAGLSLSTSPAIVPQTLAGEPTGKLDTNPCSHYVTVKQGSPVK